jgi:hypothetical protein
MSRTSTLRRFALLPVVALGLASLLGGCVAEDDGYGWGGYGGGYGHGYSHVRSGGYHYAAPAYHARQVRYASPQGYHRETRHHHDRDYR